MPYAAALSEHPLATQAVGEVVGQVLDVLGPSPDLVTLFATPKHLGMLDEIAGAVRTLLAPRTLLGAAASSVAGRHREVEDDPGLVLFAANFGARATPVHLGVTDTPDGPALTGVPDHDELDGRVLVLLTDPFSFPTDAFLDRLALDAPLARVVGGLASAARGPGGNRLLIDDRIVTSGAVGALLPDQARVSTVVSQGCRPVGAPMVVTKAERNVIYELAGKPALERLVGMLEDLNPDDRDLVRNGLHMGRVIHEEQPEFGRGDFLIRSVLGADRAIGALAVGDEVEVGSTVQFQVRDATTADEDLKAVLADRFGQGALLFTCNGRGTNLFGSPDHDAGLLADHVEHSAVAGMACAGELGPIGNRSFLHGFTASVLLFDD
jgi:small ligand-binding sensory domain FIST